MDHWKSNDFSAASFDFVGRQRLDVETKDPIVARKLVYDTYPLCPRCYVGNADLDRPKNDKAIILTNTIQMLKDLTADVNKLKAECAALTIESHELMQEENELREEKTSLKSDIENLNVQYQQRLRVMLPWAGMDPYVVMASPYSYPMPVAVPLSPIPMHLSLQPYPYFHAQNPAAMPNSCSTFVPYPVPANPPVEHPSPQYASVSHSLSKQYSRRRSSDYQGGSHAERCDDSKDVATNFELKMSGSSAPQDSSSGVKKDKQSQRKDKGITDGSSSSRSSSSQVVQESSFNNVGDVSKPNK
ncbi:unnamed protein product [Malus baccata var. baccata]